MKKISLTEKDLAETGMNAPDGFVLEEWQSLAERDPDLFEERRRQLMEQTIERAPQEYRTQLRKMQWQIDAVRKISKNPLDACIRIYEMMLAKAFGEGGLLDVMQQFCGNDEHAVMVGGAARRERRAKIITFARPAVR